nr:DUF2510 domain-containing protein [Auraticoccus cholistanensis]
MRADGRRRHRPAGGCRRHRRARVADQLRRRAGRRSGAGEEVAGERHAGAGRPARGRTRRPLRPGRTHTASVVAGAARPSGSDPRPGGANYPALVPAAGWFPDPGGRPDQLRWWDGRRWTEQVRPAGQVPGPSRPDPSRSGPSRRGSGRLLAVGAGLLVLLLVGVWVLVDRTGPAAGPGPGPGGQPTTQVCVTPSATPVAVPQDLPGRVRSGRISVPELGPPWRLEPDAKVPFGRGMMRQQISVDDSPAWIVSLNVGTMLAGDGFFTPEQGVHVVMPCLIAEYYFGEPVQRRDVRDEAIRVDGHAAWVLESELTFDIEGLDFTSERLVLVVVDLEDGTAGTVIADIPAVAADREPQLRRAIADIRISP